MRLFLGLLAWAWYLLPRPVQRMKVRLLASLLQTLRFRRDVIERNLQIAFPGNSDEAMARRSTLLRKAYDHLASLVFEILLLLGPFGLMKRYAKKRGTLKGKEHWERAREQGRGVIFLANHVGNWEIMAATGALQGIDVLLVTKKLKPEWLHRGIEEGRAACGVRGTYEPRTFRDVLGQLKQNKTVGIVLDQYTGPPVGVRVPFFGVPVGTHSILATLAKRTGAVVLPVANHRDEQGRFVTEIRPPLDWQAAEDSRLEIRQNTARYAAIVEQDVRTHPEQWLWTHKRFKGDLTPLKSEEWLQARPRA